MNRRCSYLSGIGFGTLLSVLLATTSCTTAEKGVFAESNKVDDPLWTSTRIVDRSRFDSPTKGHPYRKRSDWILRELDLQDGDVVVDVGAGDGWWAGKLARHVGKDGIVHASEITDKLVDELKRQFTGTPQVKPYRSPLDGTGLPENSCDLAFLSSVYHHLYHNDKKPAAYLGHLHKVIKPDGRLVIIENYSGLPRTRTDGHGTRLSALIADAEQHGWFPLRCEFLVGSHHYLVILAQQEVLKAKAR